MKKIAFLIVTAALAGCDSGFKSAPSAKTNGHHDGPCAAARLSWQQPTEKTNGDPLTEPIIKNTIGYGFMPGVYTATVEINSPGPNPEYLLPLDPGFTYYFAVKVEVQDVGESAYSEEVSKYIEACETVDVDLSSKETEATSPSI